MPKDRCPVDGATCCLCGSRHMPTIEPCWHRINLSLFLSCEKKYVVPNEVNVDYKLLILILFSNFCTIFYLLLVIR